MSLQENVESYLHHKGMYTQCYDTNDNLLQEFKYDHEYKFYIVFNRLGMHIGYGKSRVVYMPFLIHIGSNQVTFKCVHPYL